MTTGVLQGLEGKRFAELRPVGSRVTIEIGNTRAGICRIRMSRAGWMIAARRAARRARWAAIRASTWAARSMMGSYRRRAESR